MGAEPQPGPRQLVVVSGPSRGGKSRWAEHLASQQPLPVLYVATGGTADGSDGAWTQRVESHRLRRPPGWGTLEVGPQLEQALEARLQPQHPGRDQLLLIDSLGSWLAWHLEEGDSPWRQRCDRLVALLTAPGPPLLLVVEETGWGVVPPTAIGGLFRDRLGALQQRLMPLASEAWLVVGGRALDLLQLGVPVPEA